MILERTQSLGDFKATLSDLPFDALYDVLECLLLPDLTSLSQTSTRLRTITNPYIWKECDIVDKSLIKAQYSKDRLKKTIPWEVIVEPFKYSWFANEYVETIEISTHLIQQIVSNQKNQFVTPQNYPKLRIIFTTCFSERRSFLNIKQSIVTCNVFPEPDGIVSCSINEAETKTLFKFFKPWNTYYDFNDNKVEIFNNITMIELQANQNFLYLKNALTKFTSLKKILINCILNGYYVPPRLQPFDEIFEDTPNSVEDIKLVFHLSLGFPIHGGFPMEPPGTRVSFTKVTTFYCEQMAILLFILLPNINKLEFAPFMAPGLGDLPSYPPDDHITKITKLEIKIDISQYKTKQLICMQLLNFKNLKKLSLEIRCAETSMENSTKTLLYYAALKAFTRFKPQSRDQSLEKLRLKQFIYDAISIAFNGLSIINNLSTSGEEDISDEERYIIFTVAWMVYTKVSPVITNEKVDSIFRALNITTLEQFLFVFQKIKTLEYLEIIVDCSIPHFLTLKHFKKITQTHSSLKQIYIKRQMFGDLNNYMRTAHYVSQLPFPRSADQLSHASKVKYIMQSEVGPMSNAFYSFYSIKNAFGERDYLNAYEIFIDLKTTKKYVPLDLVELVNTRKSGDYDWADDDMFNGWF
ncbi:uncharacterized protein SAPINGB_P001470 [Magnusiomyces paraingens]|uniref:F-box domain-containing protein n=1 Tax=Magnusiomyces paraingens TaxID=2606893 RepID=A0A5E8B643_9ASCO|nr:uncharacterized protein SAPINGB_P001470 [Saprochaete ingens]VVT46954.1 unnamed protein product [Saprochaete ingens]